MTSGSQISMLCKRIATELPCQLAAIYSTEHNRLTMRESVGYPETAGNFIYEISDDSLTGRLAKHKRPFIANDVQRNVNWSYLLLESDEVRNWIGAPILHPSSSDLLGVLTATRGGAEFEEPHLQFLGKCAADAVHLLEPLAPCYGNVETLFSEVQQPTDTIIANVGGEWDRIIRGLQLQPDDIHQLTPRRFEELIAELLRRQGFGVTLTGQTRDGGRDILAINETVLGSHLFLVECKKHDVRRPVGVELVRNLYGVVEHDRATAGILCTTSRFTRDAATFARQLKHRMSLQDYADIVLWINEASDKRLTIA